MRAVRANVLLVLALAAGAGCSGKGAAKGATRESVTPLLQSEAASLKRDGEKMDPSLGVKATWNITGVEVQEQPGNEAQPFRGTIRFRINSEQREPGGVVETNFERKFEYVYDAGLGKWLFKP